MSSACRKRSRAGSRSARDRASARRTGAIQGFLKSAGLARIEDAKIETDAKKGSFYVARIEKEGRAAREVLAEILPPILRGFPWPKAMRWGAASAGPDALRWVRPLHAILCTFGGAHETPEIVPFTVGGIAAGDITYGHRFMAPQAIHVRRFDDYVASLAKAKVVLDRERRKSIILADAQSLALAHGLELIEDEGLLDEVAGLVEWPVTLMGEFDGRLPRHSARSDPRHHPRQPEVLRAARIPQPSWPGSTRPSRLSDSGRLATTPSVTTWMAGSSPAMTQKKAAQASSPTSSSSSPTSSPATAAWRSRRAMGGSCGRGSPTRATSGAPTSPPLPDYTDKATSRSTSGWRS